MAQNRTTRPSLSAPSKPVDLFTRTRDEFLEALADHERARFSTCGSVDELLSDIKALESFSKSKRRTYAWLAKVKAFGDNLVPYFKIMEIVSAAHPEWANVALGALRLILQLASHFVSFFEKLCSVIQAVNARLPRYAELYERLAADPKPPTPRLQMSLQQTYVALFEFFQAVARVFSNAGGKARGTAVVVADLMWKPFDLRFQNVVEKINFHQAIIKEELEFAATEKIQDEIEALKEVQAKQATQRAQKEILDFLSRLVKSHDLQTRERFCSSVIRWIDPPDFKENLSDAREERTEGTGEWIFDDPVFDAWRNSFAESGSLTQCPNSLLWINGKPGSGKTVLAALIVEELGRGEKVGSSPPVVCYYFFGQNSGRKSARIDTYRAIAAQIFHQCHGVRSVYDIVALATTEIATDTRASEQELVDLIRQCLDYLPNLYFVFDAVDECVDNTKFLRNIMDWCATSPIRVAVFSRPDVSLLRRSIPNRCTITLNQYLLADDISRYLMPELEDMAEQRLLHEDANIPNMVQHLTERAEGMFLWARVMMAYLNSPALTRHQRLEIVMEQTPNGLDRLEDLYSRIQDRIDSLDKPSKELAYKALLWVAHAQISGLELEEAIFPDGWDVVDGDSSPEFEHAVIVSCRGLIEKKNSGIFKYIHLTARKFAQDGPDTQGRRSPMLPDERVAKALMANRCVSYLTNKLPGKPLSGQLGVNAHPGDLVNQWPLLRYAAWNWPDLCLDALDGLPVEIWHLGITEMVTQLNDYLERGLNVMAWVETLYTLAYDGLQAKLEALISRSQDLAQSLNGSQPQIRQLLHEINEIMEDVSRLDADWNCTLVTTPCEIWGDVTIFAKSRFLVPTKAGVLESLVPTLDMEDRQDAVKPLFSTSRSSLDAKRLAILSIFPCRLFRNGWERVSNIPSYADATTMDKLVSPPRTPGEIEDACSGWTATYEILSVMASRSESVLLITIPLDPSDVEICLRQSLWYSSWTFPGDVSTWMCSFTLSIGPRLDMFTILNKLTYLDSNNMQHTTAIPLSFLLKYDDLWTRKKHFKRSSTGGCSYIYQFTWSMDGRYLAFMDCDRRGIFWSIDGSCLAVFSVTNGATGPRLAFLASFLRDAFIKGIHACQFHPSDDLLLFRDDENTYLWKFLDRGMEPKIVRFSDKTNNRAANYEATFSHCGKYLAVYSRGKPWPDLVPLEDYPGPRIATEKLYSHSGLMVYPTKRNVANNEDEDDLTFDEDTQAGDSINELTTFNSNELASLAPVVTNITSSAIVVSGGSEKTMTSCKITSNEVEIHSKNDSEEMRTPVVKLPKFIPTRDMLAQVAAPDQNDDPALYKVILNASLSRPYMSGLPSASQYLPLIVRKDARALRPVVTPLAVAGPSSNSVSGGEGRAVESDVHVPVHEYNAEEVKE